MLPALMSLAAAFFQKTAWEMLLLAVFVFVTSVQLVGVVGIVVLRTATCSNRRSWGTAVAGMPTLIDVAGAVLVATVLPARQLTVGSMVYGSSSSLSSSESSSQVCFPRFATDQPRPFGVTSSPRESRISTGSIASDVSRLWSKKPTKPVGVTRGWSFESRRQRHVRLP